MRHVFTLNSVLKKSIFQCADECRYLAYYELKWEHKTAKSLEKKEKKDERRREKRSSLRPEAKKENGPRWWARFSASFIGPSSTDEEDRVNEEEPRGGFLGKKLGRRK